MLQGEIHIDPSLSNNVQNLIFNILKVDPNERISIENVKTHPWMLDMKKLKLIALNSILNEDCEQDHRGVDATGKELSKKGKKMSIYDKKSELLKGVANRTLMVVKNKKKHNPYIKTNISLDHHNSNTITSSKEKLKQK
jgi:hypothetical protein